MTIPIQLTTFAALLVLALLSANASFAGAPEKAVILDSFDNSGGRLTVQTSGKWENPAIVTSVSAAAKLKANPLLKVDITVPPDAEDAGWLNVKLAIHGEGIDRAESAKWLLDRAPGKAGIEKFTLSWDVSSIVAKLPTNPTWFKIELVNQGNGPRTIYVSNVRAQGATGSTDAETPTAPVASSPRGQATPFPEKDQDWPGKGVIRTFGFMVGERNAFYAHREKDKGAVVFVGDSNTGGWTNLAQDFPQLKVANRGLGGDVSRGVLWRFQEDVLDLNPRAVVICIGNNDLTAMGSPADMLSNLADTVAMAQKEKPGMPVVLCTIPPSANPKAPVNAEDRKAMNEGIHKLASEHKDTHFCDLYAALANPDGSPKLECYGPDKLHMNDAGHIKWARLLMAIFEKLKIG